MVYQYKIPSLYPVAAQTAGEELDRIYREHGELKAADVVDESRNAAAPLHSIFEWNDTAAAEMYRINQAEKLIRAVVVTVPEEGTKSGQPRLVRAYVHTEESAYHPIGVVVANTDYTKIMLTEALRELAAFRKKYAALTDLTSVFDTIDIVLAENATGGVGNVRSKAAS